MYKTLFGMLAGMGILHFFVRPIINSVADATLANPSVAESVVAPVIGLVPLLLGVGIPALVAYHKLLK